MTMVRFALVVFSLMNMTLSWSLPIAARTLTCGGTIVDATDATTGDGASWRVYRTTDTTVSVQGTVGDFLPEFWAGEVGHFIEDLAVGDKLQVIIEKETQGDTVLHKGYFAAVNINLDGSDPMQFPDMTLTQIPIPEVTIDGDAVSITWQAAQADGTDAVSGYNIYRSADGMDYHQINTSLITDLSFIDTNFGAETDFYALGLVFQGNLPVSGTILSANSNSLHAIDTDEDGLNDILELLSCTNRNDADTDDDGIIDGMEDANHNGDTDTGETDPCQKDSDEDGIQDGTETGVTINDVGPDTDTGIFIPDADPTSVTDPTLKDSDGDGIADGEEDANHNGRVDEGEGDPNRKRVRALPFIPILLE